MSCHNSNGLHGKFIKITNNNKSVNYKVRRILFSIFVSVPCCGIKVVTGMGPLDDTYTLAKTAPEKPEDVCTDGCIYIRESSPGDEYCFKYKESSGSVNCQVHDCSSTFKRPIINS